MVSDFSQLEIFFLSFDFQFKCFLQSLNLFLLFCVFVCYSYVDCLFVYLHYPKLFQLFSNPEKNRRFYCCCYFQETSVEYVRG